MRDQIRVLIVDDEVVIREMLAQHLTDEEFDVVTASSGEEALKIFREDPNHLVVTDIRMGGMSGIELLENIKELDKEAVVISITSHASLDNAVLLRYKEVAQTFIKLAAGPAEHLSPGCKRVHETVDPGDVRGIGPRAPLHQGRSRRSAAPGRGNGRT